MMPKNTPPAERLISRARTQLIMDYPWFGSLALKLRVERADALTQTMATDGTRLYYNAAFVEGMKDGELRAVIAHEVLHCALLHPYRRGDREALRWNIACDEAINEKLAECGLKLPAGVVNGPADRKGMAAEQRYTLLGRQGNQGGQPGKPGKPGNGGQGGQAGQGNGPAGRWNVGEVLDAPKPGQGGQGKDQGKDKDKGEGGQGNKPGKGKDKGQGGQGKPGQDSGPADGCGQGGQDGLSESDWQIAAAQAEKVARAAGKMPGSIAEDIRKTRESRSDWRAILRRFVESTIPIDYSWTSPNRRHIHNGLYLPGVYRENVGELVVAVDTSGSVSGELLDQFQAEIRRLIGEAKPEKTHVVYCDTRVHASDEFEPDGLPFEFQKKLARGGTYFQPVFDWVKDKDIRPKALIYLTDLEPGDNPSEPGYPVLWGVPDTCYRANHPWAWGQHMVIPMDAGIDGHD